MCLVLRLQYRRVKSRRRDRYKIIEVERILKSKGPVELAPCHSDVRYLSERMLRESVA